MITEEEIEQIKQEYSAGHIQVGVELSLARKVIVSLGDKTATWWFYSFTIMMFLSFLIRYFLYRNAWSYIWNSILYIIK